MSIAVTANKRPSPFGGAEGGCGLPLKQFPLLRTEMELLALQSINMSPLTGRREIHFAPRESAIVNP